MDVSLFQYRGRQVDQALATETSSGTEIDGTQRMVQRFILKLMTEKGTLPYLPVEGSQFLTLLRRGAGSTWDLVGYFAMAMLDVKAQMKIEELPTDANTERFGNATLNSVVLEEGDVLLDIAVTSKAGVTSNIIIPIAAYLNR